MVELDNVSVRYPGAVQTAVDGVTFTVHPGERVGLLGPSGAGKSTLLNVIAGLVEPTTGCVKRNGVTRQELATRDRRASDAEVGMIHQQLLLVPSLRVIHNVNAGMLGRWSLWRALRSLWVSPRDVEAVNRVLGTLGISDKTFVRTAELSGGQQQRVALARVLRQSPSLYLADEPVSAVDPRWSDEVLSLLSDEVQRRTVSLLVSLHDVELAQRWCDRLIGLREGRVAFDLPTSQVDAAELTNLYRLS
jgi:phosphonate transport system ATP-binding protein